MIHNNFIRLWKHNAGNLTQWHYDGNGTDLLNISLTGAKHFYLSPPDSLPLYPLSNIALPIDFKETSLVEIKPGDMLYIPAYWFHKVITTEDNTMNINYVMYNKNNAKIASSRHQEIFMLHKLANTTMDKEILCVHDTSVQNAITRGFIETWYIFLIFILLFFLFLRINKKFTLIYIIVLIIMSFICFGFRGLDGISSGISRLVGLYIFIYSMILITIFIFT